MSTALGAFFGAPGGTLCPGTPHRGLECTSAHPSRLECDSELLCFDLRVDDWWHVPLCRYS